MYSVEDTAEAVGCPIRKPTDQSLLAAPRGLSQRAASFIASQCQGIHQMPFIRLFYTYECATRRRKPTRNQHQPARIRQRCIVMTQPAVSSCEATALSGHPRSLILFTCQRSHIRPRADICFLSHGYLVAGSPKVTLRHCALPPGGGGRDRTDDLMLAKHALSQLSYAPTGKDQVEQWWAREDLNFRPHAYQARALTN